MLCPAVLSCVLPFCQVCWHVQSEAAQNEMDALALAEVLVPCMAWKPPAKPQGSGAAGGPWQGLAKALTLNKTAGAAAAGGLSTGSIDAASGEAGAGVDAAAGAAAGRVAGDEQQQQQHMDEANRVLPLDDAEMEAVVTVVEYMISNFSSVFGSRSSSSSSLSSPHSTPVGVMS